ncbi:hypothetical protein DRP44_01390 [candidate division TA06 bacterium]|uniref:Fibronectin type-III domain-containing protein n=1 Tax=candidate division TA06 bacterium TaxID=2250710 RepID=A0A660SAT8_UNCT6|nr:MAG: hypothetical protein DRP44_01390 [candidate division TA06 bacterium]
MRKALILLSIPVIILALASCTVSPTENVGTPTNLAWTVGTNGLDLTISWDAVADVDGYKIITPADDTVDVDTTCLHTFVDAPVGTYSVYAYKGSENGTAATISNAPYEDADAYTIYSLNSTAGGSGFDIDPVNGQGEVVSLADSTYQATFDFYLNNDSNYVSADEFTFTSGGSGENVTGFTDAGTTEIDTCVQYVQGQTYSNMVTCEANHYYMVYFKGSATTPLDNYGIIKVVSVGSDNVVFTYKFQPLKGFRKF